MVRQAHHEDFIFSLILSLSKDEVLKLIQYRWRRNLASAYPWREQRIDMASAVDGPELDAAAACPYRHGVMQIDGRIDMAGNQQDGVADGKREIGLHGKPRMFVRSRTSRCRP